MDNNTTQQVIQTAKDAGNAIMTRVDALAAKLGVAAQYIFTLYVKQAIVSGVEDALGMILSIIAAKTFYTFGKKSYSRHHINDDFPAFAFLYILSAICVIIALFCMFNAIDLLINPQYWAMKNIIEQVKEL